MVNKPFFALNLYCLGLVFLHCMCNLNASCTQVASILHYTTRQKQLHYIHLWALHCLNETCVRTRRPCKPHTQFKFSSRPLANYVCFCVRPIISDRWMLYFCIYFKMFSCSASNICIAILITCKFVEIAWDYQTHRPSANTTQHIFENTSVMYYVVSFPTMFLPIYNLIKQLAKPLLRRSAAAPRRACEARCS